MHRTLVARASRRLSIAALAGTAMALGACATSSHSAASRPAATADQQSQAVDLAEAGPANAATHPRRYAATDRRDPATGQHRTYRNPFSQFGGRYAQENSSPSPVVPASYADAGADRGMSTYGNRPYFGIYGDMPNSVSRGDRPATLPDATENIRQITFTGEGLDFDPVVSPNGRDVVFASTRHRPTADIYLKTTDGTSVTQLTSDPAHDVMPSVSPDGRRIAFASNRNGSWDIYVMNIEGGQAVQVTSDTAHELHPTWAPDGRTLAFCRLGEVSDRWEIWTVDLDRPSRLKFLTLGLFPEWQPDGNKILFQRSRDRGDRFFSVWTVDILDGEAIAPTEIAQSNVAAIINPSWSADGSFVAFATVFDPPAPNSTRKPEFADIWIQSLDGASRSNLTGGWFVNVMPTWGPNNTIFFVSDRSGVDNIWSIGPEQAIRAAGRQMPEAGSFAGAEVIVDE
jgi:TolB protein